MDPANPYQNVYEVVQDWERVKRVIRETLQMPLLENYSKPCCGPALVHESYRYAVGYPEGYRYSVGYPETSRWSISCIMILVVIFLFVVVVCMFSFLFI